MIFLRKKHRSRFTFLMTLILIFITACSSSVADIEPTIAPTSEPTTTPTITPTVTPIPEPTTTPTPEPTAIPAGDIARQLAEGVRVNEDWTPYTEIINGTEMALVPAGCFTMGSTDEEVDLAVNLALDVGYDTAVSSWFENESPAHIVCFDEPYWLDVTEVTNRSYGSSGERSGDNLPRENINWADAEVYCKSRGARLPTEAEWEYAGRGPSNLTYSWGNEFDPTLANACDDNCTLAWADKDGDGDDGDDGYELTAPVVSYLEGVSWVGVYDLSGNVWEWLNDWYDPDYYETLTEGAVNPQGPESGTYRALRGGSWGAFDFALRLASRHSRADPGSTSDNWGFRCALSYDK